MRRVLAALLAAGLALATRAAEPAHTRVAILLDAKTARPGDTVTAAIRLRMDPDWHTYWWYAGEGGLGQPTKVDWQLPAGVTAGELEWPLPEKLPAPGSTTYIFEHEVVLLVPLKLGPELKPGPIELSGLVSWLECKGACLPGKSNVTVRLEVGAKNEPAVETADFAKWRESLPRADATLQPRASWEGAATGDKRSLVLEWSAPVAFEEADYFPGPNDAFDVLGETEKLTAPPGKIRLKKVVQKFEGDWPKELHGVLAGKQNGKRIGYATTFALDSGGSITAANPGAGQTATGPSPPGENKSSAPEQSLLGMLLSAFLGGMILNIMPCVLPVIALKILGFVSQAQSSPGRVKFFGFVYAAGVLASFLALALIVIGIKAAGHKAGWGIQFSNPFFVVGVTTLVTLVALNLFGVFEVTLSGKVMGAAGDLSSKEGASGAFFNGVLATILATPCTAPFLGAALGFAFGQPALTILLIFLTVGLGLATPYVVLSCQPAWLKFMPKPGVWMEKFKMAMGFPMLATALWLGSLASSFYGERSWWLGVFLVFVGAAAWVFGDFFQRGSKRRGMALAVVALLLVTGVCWALESGLQWRTPLGATGTSGATTTTHAPEGYPWQAWSADAVAKAQGEGRPVVVDFTAKWCQTCNINVKPAFESESVVRKLKALNAVALVADYTRFPDDITDELAKFQRRGVPLVLVYSRRPNEAPAVLPEPLPYPAPYSSVILAALEKITQ